MKGINRQQGDLISFLTKIRGGWTDRLECDLVNLKN
jgi:hypothetical protein